MKDIDEQDKRLSWRSKRVLTTGVGLALFATMLAVAVHTGQRYSRQPAASARMAPVPTRTTLTGLDATPPAPDVAEAFSPPAATATVREAPATGRDPAGDRTASAVAPAAGAAPVGIEAGGRGLAPEPEGVARLAMAAPGGIGHVGGGGFAYGHAGPGGGSAGAASADSGGGAGGRNLSSASSSGAEAAGGTAASAASPEGSGADSGAGGNSDNTNGDGANDNNAGGNGDNTNGDGANDNNAGGNGSNGNNAGGGSANDDQDPLAFAGSTLAALPGAVAPLGAGDTGQPDFGSAAGETAQVEVPEPATLGMLAFGLAGLGLSRGRRRRD